MTREEDLKEEGRIAVGKYARELGDYTFGEGSMVEMFVLGANYADQHPRKGLWDGKKVVDWLNSWFTDNICQCRLPITKDARNTLFNDLRKAMED